MASKTTRAKGKTRGVSEAYAKAVDALDKAVKALYKGDAARAKDQLVRIRENHAGDMELMDRVSSYLLICERQLAPQRRPKTPEEMINLGVLSLNEGDPTQAIKHLSKALDAAPKNPQAAYCLAAAHAICGDASASAKNLKLAIGADPSARVQAQNDEDFASVRSSSEIASLLAEA